jgi:uncharacterized protein (TIGR03083 family)
MTRDELLKRIDDGRAELTMLLARVPEERMSLPALSNGWTVKDLLGHLAAWEKRATHLYRMLSTNQTVDDGISDFNEFNAAAYQANLNRPLAVIQAEEREAFAGLRAVAEKAPEGHLFDPAQFAWTEGRPFADWIGWNSYEHYEEHLPDLRAWLGD